MNFSKWLVKKMKFYHKASPLNRESILLNGLIPQIGDSYQCHSEGKYGPVVFVCEDKSYDSTWDDDIYEIELDEKVLHKDLSIDGCFFTKEKIDISLITLIYKGSGDSTF